MGTRSVVRVYDEDAARPFVMMYRQYDGYPSVAGAELAAFLASRPPVDGFSRPADRTANGPGCLAALMVARFKGDSVGGFYLYPPNLRPADVCAEYVYDVRLERFPPDAGRGVGGAIGAWHITCYEVGARGRLRRLYDGRPGDFLAWCRKTEGAGHALPVE